VVVVNTGTSYRHGQQLLQAIRRVTDKPVRVAVVTHTRHEFLMGAAAFQAEGIPVTMHHQAAELMRGRCERCLKKLQTLLGMEAMQGTVIFKPNQEPEDAALLQDAGRRIRLLYFGHSSGPGDMTVLDEQSGVVFGGGLVDNQRIPDVQDGNLSGWADALQQLRTLSPRLIVPGHGAAGTLALLDAEDRYLTQLQARVSGLLQQGSTLQTVADAATLPDFAGWDGYDTLHKRNAATVFLRLEQATARKPQGQTQV
jgi:glyoxylase-like metal-dependent hydrolase (beta-lactamase superfamily II)